MDLLFAPWLPDNHSALTLWNKASQKKKTRDFLATSWKMAFKKNEFFSVKFGGSWRTINRLLIRNYHYFVPFEIYVYIIFWNIIYSLQEMNSTTMWGGWCTPFSFGCLVGFVSFAIPFFSQWGRYMPVWESNMALSLEGQLQADSWNRRHPKSTESRASPCFYLVTQGSSSSWFIAFYPVQY